MSVRAITWAFEQRLEPTDHVVLLALADWADHGGYCFPGHDAILSRVVMSRRTLVRVLKKLVDMGYITRERRTGPAGHRISDGYWLNLDGDGQNETRETLSANLSHDTGGNPYVPRMAHTSTLLIEPSVEPSEDLPRTRLDAPTEVVIPAPDFDDFWSRYPRRVGKPAAARAWDSLVNQGVDTRVIMNGLAAHLPGLMSRELQFTPHPSTWLNQRRFEDDPVAADPPPAPRGRSARETPTERLMRIAQIEDPTARQHEIESSDDDF